MMETILSLRTPNDWMLELSEKHGITIKVLACRQHGNRVHQLVEIVSPEGRVNDALKKISSHKGVVGTDITQVDDIKAVGCIGVSRSSPYALLLKSECTFISGRTTGEGRVVWNLIVSKNKPLQKLVNSLRAKGVSVELHKLSRIEDQEILTARQEEILQVALDRGFFDHPKKVGLRELAKTFGISASTLSEVLRKGLKKIIELHLSQEKDQKIKK
jgi:predicted DNA binding protein